MDKLIDVNEWDTVIAVNGNDLEIYVQGQQITNIGTVDFSYFRDELPIVKIERVSLDKRLLFNRQEGAEQK